MAKKPKSARTERRERERARGRLAEAGERLARLEPGGAPERPIVVATPSLVEVQARSMPCARCGGPVQVIDHTAETLASERLRIAHVRCSPCGFARPVYFVLEAVRLN